MHREKLSRRALREKGQRLDHLFVASKFYMHEIQHTKGLPKSSCVGHPVSIEARTPILRTEFSAHMVYLQDGQIVAKNSFRVIN